jgi:hypothetical protein
MQEMCHVFSWQCAPKARIISGGRGPGDRGCLIELKKSRATKPKLKYCGNNRLPAYGYGGSGHAKPRNAAHGAVSMAASAISGLMWRHAVQGGHWLDHDPIALAVLVIGIGIVVLFALSI